MNEEAFNLGVRKFLKKFGVTAQREIEKAVDDGVRAVFAHLDDCAELLGEERGKRLAFERDVESAARIERRRNAYRDGRIEPGIQER